MVVFISQQISNFRLGAKVPLPPGGRLRRLAQGLAKSTSPDARGVVISHQLGLIHSHEGMMLAILPICDVVA